MTTDALAARIAEIVNEALRSALVDELPKVVAEVSSACGPAAPRPLVDIHAVAQFFGISEVTIRRMVGEGMPVEWVASAMRFDVDECRKWNRERGKRSVTKGAPDRKRPATGPVGGVTLKSRSR